MIPLKLIFVFPSMKSGGGNRVFIELCNLLAEEFENITVLYPNNSSDRSHYQKSAKLTFLKIGSNAKGTLKKLYNVFVLLRHINNVLKTQKSTIIIISDPILCVFFSLFGDKNNKRVIRFIQADDYRIYDDLYILKNKYIVNIYKMLCKNTFRNFSNYIFNSVYTYQQYLSASGRKLPMYLVHPGIDTNIFKAFKPKFEDRINICVVARKHPWKGFSDFLQAISLLNTDLKRRIDKVSVISHDDLGEFEMPVNFDLVRPDNDLQIAEIMNEAHIFVSTSWWEGFGLPPLEAMACGCAVLSSNSKGIMEYAVDGHNILLYEPRNAADLCAKLEFLISDKTYCQKMALNGTSDAKHFTWHNAAGQFIDYIKLHYQIV